MRQQRIEAAIQPRVVDLRQRHAEQILQRGVVIPALGHRQLARLRAKAAQGEHAGDHVPADVFLATRHQLGQQRVQAEPPPQRQSQIDAPELPQPLDAHARQIDLAPARRHRRRGRGAQLELDGALPTVEQRLEFAPTARALHRRAVELAQAGDDLVARPAGGAHGLHQRPVFVSFAARVPALTFEEHAGIIPKSGCFNKRVFGTTSPFCQFGAAPQTEGTAENRQTTRKKLRRRFD